MIISGLLDTPPTVQSAAPSNARNFDLEHQTDTSDFGSFHCILRFVKNRNRPSTRPSDRCLPIPALEAMADRR